MSTTDVAPRTERLSLLALVFCVSAGALLLQFVQTRILGVIFWNHLVYFIISIALMGFGISGTWLSLADDPQAPPLGIRLAGVGFLLSGLISTLLPGFLSVSLATVFSRVGELMQLLICYAAAVIPYFFAGWILGLVFQRHAGSIGQLYGADFVGAAVGCFLFLGLINPLGGVLLLCLACLLVFLPTQLWPDSEEPLNAPRLAGIGGAVLLLALTGWFHEAIDRHVIVPEASKSFHNLFRNLPPGDTRVVEFSAWNSISRIDVVSSTKQPDRKFIFIDGDAYTQMVPSATGTVPQFEPERENMLLNRVPYLFRRPAGKVLVIGVGGGPDVWNALRGGAGHVDAVEINPTTCHVIRDLYPAWNHGLFHRPEVNLANEEGRSFVRRSKEKYDVIMMHGTDTFAALNAGAYVLSENFLYTVEGFRDYLHHLADDGILCVTRWGTLPESVRLFAVALESMVQEGWAEPGSHVALVWGTWVTVLIKKQPFTPTEIQTLVRQCESTSSQADKAVVGFVPVRGRAAEGGGPYSDYFNLRMAATSTHVTMDIPFDVTPTYDDNPFFFHYERWLDTLGAIFLLDFGFVIRGYWASMTLWGLLLFSLIGTRFFMILPLRRKFAAMADPGGVSAGSGWRWWLVYFCALGISYIFVEIALMQRFALLLGHPARSLALVLGTLLFASGVGSLTSSRFPARVIFPGAIVMTLLVAFLYPRLSLAILAWPLLWRQVACAALVFPVGFFLGMPFPYGISQVRSRPGLSVAWMWGVNGGSTVLGSVLAIILAMGTNFTTVLSVGAVGYGLAFLAAHRSARDPA